MKVFSAFSLFFLFSLSIQASVLVTNGLTHRHVFNGINSETGYIILKNIGEEPERIQVYARDLKVACSEDYEYEKPGTLDRSNAAWISVAVEERLIQPGEELPIRYEILVPHDSTLHGSYWSVLMIEVKKPIDTTSLEHGVRLSSSIRYGVQIITDVGEPSAANIDFSKVVVHKDSEERLVEITLYNLGNKVLVPKLKVEVFDTNGELVLEQKGQIRKLYPMQCKAFKVSLGALQKGKYQGILVADCGSSDLFGMTLNLAVND